MVGGNFGGSMAYEVILISLVSALGNLINLLKSDSVALPGWVFSGLTGSI